jgi:predicted nuclease of predicted toxin-antitoxin system
MRLLANENFPTDAAQSLREAGHDVGWIRADSPGVPDPVVLARAVREGRVLVTFDKDFGDLAFHSGLPTGCGVILFRLRAGTSAELAQQIVAALSQRSDWEGHFAVVEPGKVRLRPLPTPPDTPG